ncbi:MAG: hypothetical protein U9Q04_06255 [Campylobacterota bacterium]|nr:hypothetical protein [Campylobacterota bacterium]
MKEYINDIKIVLFVLAVVFGTIIWKWDYFFSTKTMNEVKIIDTKQVVKTNE